MQYSDSYTIRQMGMPSLVLMERAALQVVHTLEKEEIDCSDALIVCGSGNNGGDGLAIARLLTLKGYHANVWYIGNYEKASEDNKKQYQIAKNYGVSVRNILEEKEYSVIIDAIFGTGLKRDIEGAYKEAIDKLNLMKGFKAAVDIPSGISDTTGEVRGAAFMADLTISFAFEKLGTVLYPGANYAGKVITADIGITKSSLPASRKVYTYEKKDLKKLLPVRNANSHKGSYGKVLMIAGSEGMAGAAYLNAKAAYSVGAGLVRIYTPKENRAALQQLLPEAIVTTYSEFDKNVLKELLDWADVVAIGSGLGTGELSEQIFTYTMQYAKLPCVIDGDGINLLSEDLSLLEHKKQVVLTPHLKEMSRLLQCEVTDIKENRLKLLDEFTGDYPAVCVLKDARTFVAYEEQDLYLNTTGNAAMAKAGSGDVLAGIITGLLAQGTQKQAACAAGVFIHGLCGDYAGLKKGSYSVTADDLIDELSNVLKELEEE